MNFQKDPSADKSPMSSTNLISLAEVEAAQKRIDSYITKTPIITSDSLNKVYSDRHKREIQLFFKAEHMQNTGSFKIRGAANAMLNLLNSNDDTSTNNDYTTSIDQNDFISSKSEVIRTNRAVEGIVSYSSGNHGLALAHLCRLQGLQCIVVVPDRVPSYKQKKIKMQGAEVVLADSSSFFDKIDKAQYFAKIRKNHFLIEPSDNRDVIVGQATIALEMFEQVGHLDALVLTLSGGGLMSGMAMIAKMNGSNCRIFAAEPLRKNFAKCLRNNDRFANGKPAHLPTEAEGIMSGPIGELPLQVMIDKIDPDDVFEASDEEMKKATDVIKQHLNSDVELSSGAALAALDQVLQRHSDLKRIGLVLCGGNIPDS